MQFCDWLELSSFIGQCYHVVSLGVSMQYCDWLETSSLIDHCYHEVSLGV